MTEIKQNSKGEFELIGSIKNWDSITAK